MREVLMVYREVFLQGDRPLLEGVPVPTVSVDEKPGVQAMVPDLPPQPDRRASLGRRDAEYRHLGTLSILAALDLHSGEVIAQVEERHRSREFVLLLQELDRCYPPDAILRIVLDHHASHTSKETRAYLATRPNRFQYVHTPKHGSWLNLIETVFSRMARTLLRHIRVNSLEELKLRIETGIREMNEAPVPIRWRKFDMLEPLHSEM